MMDSAGNPREMVTIRARDKTTGKDLILNVPKDASMEEVRARAERRSASFARRRRRPLVSYAGHGRIHAKIQRAGGKGALQGRVQARPPRPRYDPRPLPPPPPPSDAARRRFVSNGRTVSDTHKIEDLPTSNLTDGTDGETVSHKVNDDGDDELYVSDIGCGSVACTQGAEQGCLVM